eukprot:GEMP01029250.1.p1 GENE.GEMP01029250.1~~GEMP01029250.1.p1  ORF type:complete len:261 (+),score=48.98 GEMP01029250.1:74-856(+)
MGRVGQHIIEWPIAMLSYFVKEGYEEDVLAAIDVLHDYEQTEVGLRRIASNQFPFRQSIRQQNIAFFVAARKQVLGGSYRILKKLRAIGIPLDKIDYFKQTPLFFASREHDLKGIKLLVAAGCRLEQLDKNKQTCLYYAARDPNVYCDIKERGKIPEYIQRRISTTKLLVDMGCPTDTIDIDHKTVADYCANVKGLENILLLPRGENPAPVHSGVHQDLSNQKPSEWHGLVCERTSSRKPTKKRPLPSAAQQAAPKKKER